MATLRAKGIELHAYLVPLFSPSSYPSPLHEFI
jgi:hypothetical protein